MRCCPGFIFPTICRVNEAVRISLQDKGPIRSYRQYLHHPDPRQGAFARRLRRIRCGGKLNWQIDQQTSGIEKILPSMTLTSCLTTPRPENASSLTRTSHQLLRVV